MSPGGVESPATRGIAARRARSPDDESPIRVVIADDSYMIREFLTTTLNAASEVELVAICSNGKELRTAIELWDPDVVLTDIRMPPSGAAEGVRIAASLRESHPHVGVVVLSQYAEPGYALALLERGSDGRAYLLKDRVHNRAELTAAIRSVAEGGSMIDPKIVEGLVAARARTERSPLNELSAREREVLSQIAQGRSNAAIAESLFLTKRAIEKHINSIFLKLNLGNGADISRRVKATLMFLAAVDSQPAEPAQPR